VRHRIAKFNGSGRPRLYSGLDRGFTLYILGTTYPTSHTKTNRRPVIAGRRYRTEIPVPGMEGRAERLFVHMRSLTLSRIIAFVALAAIVLASRGSVAAEIDLDGWSDHFSHHYDYVLRETEGLDRKNEPVEVTLTMAGDPAASWREHIRVAQVSEEGLGALVPHQVMGSVHAGGVAAADGKTPHPATSTNIIFLANCRANRNVTYRLYWGKAPSFTGQHIPSAVVEGGLQIAGETPGLTIENDTYRIQLDQKSGAIETIRTTFQNGEAEMRYRTIPAHFGVDIWSPGQDWDHDYDWPVPPNQKVEGGALALRYHRWGPMNTYRDVEVSITYTFYAHVPYVYVSSTMRLTEDRSAHAIRMGEIVVNHSRQAREHADGTQEEREEVFTHYGWPDGAGDVVQREINAHRNTLGQANVEGFVPGGLGVLDRDIPWVAGYNTDQEFGLATLRKNQFSGNYLGGPTPQSAPCTYLGQYGWGFVYWSRPMVYPLGTAKSDLDLNTAVAAGSIFGTEEALLIFKPDSKLKAVAEAQRRLVKPLRLEFKGTGPW
jgi:hypothetical protein